MNIDRVNALISYLGVLQRGRSKPNTNGPGDIKESLSNIPDIDAVKIEINKELDVFHNNFTSEFKKNKYER